MRARRTVNAVLSLVDVTGRPGYPARSFVVPGEKVPEDGLWIPREDAQKLGENEYYIGDLIGMQVVTEEDLLLGTVSDVLQTGANDVYVVSSEGKKDLLLPAVRQCILSVDVNKNRMTVRLMKGMEP